MSSTQVSVGARGLIGSWGWVHRAKPQCFPCTVEANEDYEDYYGEEAPGEAILGDDPEAHTQPVTPLQLFEGRRNRRRREAPKAGSEQDFRVQYTVCIW